jgi:hypothetical protein
MASKLYMFSKPETQISGAHYFVALLQKTFIPYSHEKFRNPKNEGVNYNPSVDTKFASFRPVALFIRRIRQRLLAASHRFQFQKYDCPIFRRRPPAYLSGNNAEKIY